MALTDLEVKRAKPMERPYKLTDSGNLFLWVTPAGEKIWRWAYRFHGRAKLMTLGKYPEVPLSRARDRHEEARRVLSSGAHPMAQRRAKKLSDRVALGNSFASISELWLEHWQVGKSLRHVDSTRRRLAANILPSLGSLPVAEVEAPDLVAMIRAIDRRGASDIAKRTLEIAGQIFRYSIAHGYAKRNPAAEIRPRDVLRPAVKTNYARIDERELPTLLRQMEVYRGTHITRPAMKLLALTFVRTWELIQARWTEFRIDEARWDIPAERMKMRTPHIVPLSKQAVEVLSLLRELTGGSVWVFPGERSSLKPMSNNTILKGLERMGYKSRMAGHGFRGLASTLLHEQGYAHEYIELQLAHTPRNAVSAAYNQALHLKARTRMMQDWADFLEAKQRGSKAPVFEGGQDVA